MVSVVADLDTTGLEDLTGGKLSSRFADPFTFHTITWDDGDFFTVYRNGDDLHFAYLTSTRGEHRLKQLVGQLPAFFRVRGIERFVTTASGATEAMLHVGFAEDHGYLVCPIHEGSRMDVYASQPKSEQSKQTD